MKPIVDEAVKRLGYKAHVQLICNPVDIEKQKFDQLPVLMVNDQVIVEGKVPSIFTMPALIQKSVDKNTEK